MKSEMVKSVTQISSFTCVNLKCQEWLTRNNQILKDYKTSRDTISYKKLSKKIKIKKDDVMLQRKIRKTTIFFFFAFI